MPGVTQSTARPYPLPADEAGRLAELRRYDILDTPRHPYTHGLIGSIPSANIPGQRLYQIPGMTPPIDRMPRGCRFRPRCPNAQPLCQEPVALREIGAGRQLRCNFPMPSQDTP